MHATSDTACILATLDVDRDKVLLNHLGPTFEMLIFPDRRVRGFMQKKRHLSLGDSYNIVARFFHFWDADNRHIIIINF